MSAPRQQRGNQSRGSLPFRTTATAGQYNYTFRSVLGAVLSLNLDTEVSRLVLAGVPGFIRQSTGQPPVSADINLGYLQLNFGSNLQAGEVFTIQSRDPGLRGPNGEYLAPGSTSTPQAPPPFGVSYMGQFSNFVSNMANIITDDGGQQSAVPPTEPQDWLLITVIPTVLVAPAFTGPIMPTTVAPGASIYLKWDGANWTV